MKVIKKETISKTDHKPNEKKKRVKSKYGRAVKNVLKDLLKINFAQKAMVNIPKKNGIILNAKNSFFEKKSRAFEMEDRLSPAGKLAVMKMLIKDPPIK